jgi:hypothetical protein
MYAIAIIVQSYMTKEIDIQLENQNHGYWIKIYIPFECQEKMTAVLQNQTGEILRLVQLTQGNNAIDISYMNNQTINLKIETPNQTILKKIKI